MSILKLYDWEREPLWEIICIQRDIDYHRMTPGEARQLITSIRYYDINHRIDLGHRRRAFLESYCAYHRISVEQLVNDDELVEWMSTHPTIIATEPTPSEVPVWVQERAMEGMS